MGCAFTARIANAEFQERSTYQPIPTAEVYFYAAGLPMATMLAADIDFLLHQHHLLSPVVSIIWSIIAFGAWIFVLVMWGVSEWSPDTGGFLPFYRYMYVADVYGSGLFYGRTFTGCIAALFALVQMSVAARAVELERKQRKSGSVQMGNA